MSKLSVAILGASRNRKKFGNKAVRAYALKGYTVYPVNLHEVAIEGHKVYSSIAEIPSAKLDRVCLYLHPDVGIRTLPDLAQKTIQEIWLNPGSESPELIAAARVLGLDVVLGCSILDIGVNPGSLED